MENEYTNGQNEVIIGRFFRSLIQIIIVFALYNNQVTEFRKRIFFPKYEDSGIKDILLRYWKIDWNLIEVHERGSAYLFTPWTRPC